MTILEENSKLLVESIKDLYLKGKYELEYAIVQLNKFYSNGRITKKDFEEYCEYFKTEREKQNSAEIVEEDTVENDTVVDQEKEIENKENIGK